MIQAIFFDIDGTLVSFQTHRIPDSTKQALYALKEKGILLFVATGRAKDGLAVLEDFPFDGYITLNGQYCFTKDNEVIYENTIDPRDIKVLMEELKTHSFPCGFVKQNEKVFNYRDERVEKIHEITQNDNHPAGDISNIEQEKIYQVMTFINAEEEKELLKKMPHCTSARWYPTFCDISPIGGTKVKGIDCFLEKYHIDLDNVMAIGDGGNDYEMLKHVGIAVAMGNADEKVKAICDYISDDVDHDGIYHAMQYYQLI